MTDTSAPAAVRFNDRRPDDLRRSPPWHPLAHIIRLLPRALEELSRDLRVPPGGRVLDFGCAEMPYRRFFGPDVDFVGADLPGNPDAAVEIRPDGTVPLEDSSCDAVLSTQVLEHVADPQRHLAECRRVLRPGGRLLLSTHGIMVWHPDPVDLWRWTGEGLRRAVADAGFEVVRFEGIMGLGATGLQLFQDAAYPAVPRLLRPLVSLALQAAIELVDRLTSAESRRANALVFALVAERP